MMNQEELNRFARQNGYDHATYLCEWRGYQCYEPMMAGEGPFFVGLPLLILVDKEKRIRMSTPQEALQQIKESKAKSTTGDMNDT